MSRKSEKIGNISRASSLIISGRGTSTPIDEPTKICADLSFRNQDNRAKKSLNFLHPAIEYANKPIFGRRNLQLLSDCANEAANVAPEFGFSLQAGETTIGFNERITDTISAHKTLSSNRSKNELKKPKSKGPVNTAKKVRNTSRTQESTVKESKSRRSISSRKTSVSTTNKCRSNQSNPVFKVTPKCPKSPRSLATIRAKAKEHRKRRSLVKKDEEKSKIPVRQNEAENENYVGTIPKCPKSGMRSVDTRTEFKIKEAIPVFKHTNGSSQEKTKPFKSSLLSSSGIRKKNDSKKMCKRSALSECLKDLKSKEKNAADIEKLAVFKAGPIRTYAPVQPIKPRPITLPESPRIGQRHRLHSCPR
ncbi:uncharacterized protein LOC100678857 [Nasonia vitripennis]|uniref:Uncharacterized protein n=1 Tax=Nasonia vitripennis TaxID=7425 RepID=A0A7M7LKQ2_NASVI|nr:uncharacterized protein LOC100678857 [Nasonia vitripennis]